MSEDADQTRYHSCRVSAYTEEDDDGFYWVVCGCGLALGPAPDQQTAVDVAMEHAWERGYATGGTTPRGRRTGGLRP